MSISEDRNWQGLHHWCHLQYILYICRHSMGLGRQVWVTIWQTPAFLLYLAVPLALC